MNKGALLSGRFNEGTLELVAGGSWTAVHAGELEELIDQWLARTGAENGESGPSPARQVRVDLGRVDEFDTYGAWLLERLRRSLRAREMEMHITGLPGHERELLQTMHNVNQPMPTEGAPGHSPVRMIRNAMQTVGRAMSGIGADLRSFNAMLGTLSAAFVRILLQPRRFRLTSAVHQLDRVGWRAVPIILLITFLIGAIIAQQGFFHFRKFGADIYVVDMVGILVLRELGVLLVAIMVAGRSGSAFTAELGSMKMREEIDALKTMGFDPVEVLILPRVLVLIVALPMLTFLGSMAALYGGGLVAWLYGGMDPDIYIERLKEAINLTHFKVGLIKAPFMGAVIGVLACMEGLKVRGSAASLGQQTTRSVVKSIFMVIVLDGLFAMFFAAIGM